jgi:S1-C subfamily serine protease
MKGKLCSIALVILIASLLAPRCLADNTSALLKQEGYTLSLELKFTKKNPNPLQRAAAFLDWGPNGYATGFVVGDGLVMTAYHVVSGDLSISKKAVLGFAATDQLEVKVYINGCQAVVLKVDADADLALLGVCRPQKQMTTVAFQTDSPGKDENLLLIARPHGSKMVRRGIFSGPYMFRGQQYWSAKIDGRDGYSGSPVYNNKAELVGVFSGYDGSKKLAVISPGVRAQKLLEDYISNSKP